MRTWAVCPGVTSVLGPCASGSLPDAHGAPSGQLRVLLTPMTEARASWELKADEWDRWVGEVAIQPPGCAPQHLPRHDRQPVLLARS